MLKNSIGSLGQMKIKAQHSRPCISFSHAELCTSQTQAATWAVGSRNCHNLCLNFSALPHLATGTHSPLSSGELSWLWLHQLQIGCLLEYCLLQIFSFECSSFFPPIWMNPDIFLLGLHFVVTWLWWSFSFSHLSFWEALWILSGVHASNSFSVYSSEPSHISSSYIWHRAAAAGCQSTPSPLLIIRFYCLSKEQTRVRI